MMILFLKMLMFISERKRQSMGRVGQREKETQNLKQAPSSELSAQSSTQGSNPQREIMTWAEVGRLTDWATQAPQDSLNFNKLELIKWVDEIVKHFSISESNV